MPTKDTMYSEYEQNQHLKEARGRLSTGHIGGKHHHHHNDLDYSEEQTKKAKADFKPEVFFLGQIVGGSDFYQSEDGLFLEATLKYGEDWTLFDMPGKSIQTQTAYADDEGFYVFAHPFDF